jgi:menaquinone-dependent protoporphyrinogen IX oxidase
MNKTAVVFQSKYGSTKQYAEWIADELSCGIFERTKIKAADLLPFDTIIYGGGLYAGGVSGIDLLTKNYDKLRGKNLILFTCGLADPTDTYNTGNIKKSLCKVFTDEMQDKIKVFHLRGAIDYKKLGMIHKSMMAMLRKMLVKKDYDSLRNEDKEILDTYGKAVDFKDRATIFPIVSYIRGL